MVVDVSVILPSCNRCEMLRKCLEGLAAQTYPSYEVVVIDDGSSDDTPDMIAAFADEHPELKLLSLQNESNRGANPSRNRGVAASHGRYVAFIDSDCVPDPKWLASLLARFSSPRVAAVVGTVEDTPPRNLYDLAIYGAHRIHGPKTNRLVAGNMCIRRDQLLQFQLDEDRVSEVHRNDGSVDTTAAWGCDEEGLALSLRAAGYDILVAEDAIVEHDHHYGRQSFFHQAYRGGRATARLVYKYHLLPRLDLAPWMLAYGSLLLLGFGVRLAAVPCAFFGVSLAAIVYNELFRKEKTLIQLLQALPLLVLYYQVRLAGYASEAIRLRMSPTHIQRVRLSARSPAARSVASRRAGTVCGIAYRLTHGDSMRQITECVVIARRGLELEDRHHGKREVTLLSQEAWSDACQEVGRDMPWTLRRANLLVSGVDLSVTVGTAITVGETRIWIHGQSHPCQVMDDQVPGLREALKPDGRGGVHGQVVSGGVIRVGDSVRPGVSSPERP